MREEDTFSPKFKKHCMLLADIYISLLDLVKKADKGRGKLYFFTKPDLKGVQHLIFKEPDAYFAIEDKKKNTQRYFLKLLMSLLQKRDGSIEYLSTFNILKTVFGRKI